MTLKGTSNKNESWKSCIKPSDPYNSVYIYCDKLFEKDYFQRNRCKSDMCRLCCISYEPLEKTILTNKSIDKCYTGCLECK